MTLGSGVLGGGVLGGDVVAPAPSGFQAAWVRRQNEILGAKQMYPINNASPERIAVGQVILIADGTIQTSTVVITVRGQGGAEATGGGTTAFGAEGTVYYTPTQAETNFTSFTVIASKASCFSASQTIVTTASATAGRTRLESVSHTGATIPTVTTLTGHTAQTGDNFAGNVKQSADNDTKLTTLLARIIGTLAAGTHNPATSAQIAVLSDWANGGRLDLILDSRMAEASISTTAGAINLVTLVDTLTTYTSNTPQSQDNNVLLTAIAGYIDTEIAAIINTLGVAGAGLTDLGGMSTAMKAEVLTEVVKVLVTQMTESYAADGTAPTLTQAVMLIQQALTEFAFAGTLNTVKQLNGSTTAAVMTLDDGTNPTSSTRTS